MKEKILLKFNYLFDVGHLDFVGLFDNYDWKIIITKTFELSQFGEQPVNNSDKLIGCEMILEMVFLPSMHKPNFGRIPISWTDKVVKFDLTRVIKIIEENWGFDCNKLLTECKCRPQREEIHLGPVLEQIAQRKDYAIDALKRMGFKKHEIDKALDITNNEIRDKTDITFEKYIALLLKNTKKN